MTDEIIKASRSETSKGIALVLRLSAAAQAISDIGLQIDHIISESTEQIILVVLAQDLSSAHMDRAFTLLNGEQPVKACWFKNPSMFALTRDAWQNLSGFGKTSASEMFGEFIARSKKARRFASYVFDQPVLLPIQPEATSNKTADVEPAKKLLEMLDKAVLHIQNNKNDEALKLLDELTPPKSAPTFFYAKAVAEAGLGKFEKAKSSLEELLQTDPNYYPGKDFLTQINNILLRQD